MMRTHFTFLCSTSLCVLLGLLFISEFALAQTITYKGLIYTPKEGTDSVLFVIPKSWDNYSGVNIPMEIKDKDGKLLPVAGIYPQCPLLKTWDRLKLNPLFSERSLKFRFGVDMNRSPQYDYTTEDINNHELYAILNGFKVTLPETMKEIPDELLSHYYDGLKINFPQSQKNRYIEDSNCLVDSKRRKVVAVNFSKMERKGAGRIVKFPATATSFSGAALRGRLIAEVIWPEQMTKIEPNSFEACIFTEDVTIPGHIQHIGAAAFQRATGMGVVTLEEGVISIDSMAFNENNLSKIIIPSSLVQIGRLAFSDCRLLEEVVGKQVAHTAPDAYQSCYKLLGKAIPASYHEKIEANNKIVLTQMWQTWHHSSYYIWSRRSSKKYSQLNATISFNQQGRLQYTIEDGTSKDDIKWFFDTMEMGLISPYAWISSDAMGTYELKMDIKEASQR